MPIFLLALVGIGIFAIAGRAGAVQHAQQRLLPPPVQSAGITPITMLGAYMNAGQMPPPAVIAHSIAQATAAGDHVLAHQIGNYFDQISARAGTYAPESAYYAPPVAPYPAPPAPVGPGSPPSAGQPMSQSIAAPGYAPDGFPLAAKPTIPQDHIDAAIAAMGMPGGHVERTRDGEYAIPSQMPDESSQDSQDSVAISGVLMSGELAYLPPQQDASAYYAHSPIETVPDDRWGAFMTTMEREAPTFVTPQHVGRFRQRRERVAALGFEPGRLAVCTDRQYAAFAAEMSDSYRHLEGGGLTDYVGQSISIPQPQGPAQKVKITLSGLLGIAQTAGLEGAVEWLERYPDRLRFPNTTRMFMRTNGMF